jgi:hypothetical protein
MSRADDPPEPDDDAINDPDVLWAVIEGLLARLSRLRDPRVDDGDPQVLVVAGGRAHHLSRNCPLLVETTEGATQSEGRAPEILRIPKVIAVDAGIGACPACRTHRGRSGGVGSER